MFLNAEKQVKLILISGLGVEDLGLLQEQNDFSNSLVEKTNNIGIKMHRAGLVKSLKLLTKALAT